MNSPWVGSIAITTEFTSILIENVYLKIRQSEIFQRSP
uniref:Uncharacterized protein n=1 Tax=Candidatus Kentrum sp. FW TaxID=2126338 RepID=A0A450SYP4_9GAMM|nr:MAG: hypothetical protein BECKFW1821A_GA0114235_100290 [Candidatus Kentron sp. FW]VFJ59059.1 MAG: hypothetical protein BECKFW1821B_GA0114236_104513 [Candidatus Kentron sp. FW]